MTSTIFIGCAVGLFHFANGSPAVGIAYATAGIIGRLVPLLLRVTGSLVIVGNAGAFLVFASHLLVVCFTGGLGLPALVTQVGAPMLAIVLPDRGQLFVLDELVARRPLALQSGLELVQRVSLQGFIDQRHVDEGTGIPEDLTDRIFDPFFTTEEVGKGTGLGLSVSYGIIQERGGTIRVESAPGVGSRFTVVLPRNLDIAAFPDDADETPD